MSTFFSKVFNFTPLVFAGITNKTVNFRLLIESHLLDRNQIGANCNRLSIPHLSVTNINRSLNFDQILNLFPKTISCSYSFIRFFFAVWKDLKIDDISVSGANPRRKTKQKIYVPFITNVQADLQYFTTSNDGFTLRPNRPWPRHRVFWGRAIPTYDDSFLT